MDYNRSSYKKNEDRQIERGGLVPVTCGIIRKATINSQEQLSYDGVQISDVSIVGRIMDFKETETRVTVKLWESSGSVEVTFYSKNENEGSSGLSNFVYQG